MTDNYIQLKKNDLLTIHIKTDEGIDTGETLVFDLEDVELPLIMQETLEKIKKSKEWFKNQILLIQKREDIKGKKLLSKNEEDAIKTTKEYIDRVVEAFNMFLGENGVQKLLNGRKPSVENLFEVEEIVVNQIQPMLDINMKNIMDKMKAKYGKKEKEEIEVL